MLYTPINPPLNNHVVICNCNEKVRGIVRELHADAVQNPHDIVLLIQDRALWEKNPDWHPKESARARIITMFGSPFEKECLSAAWIENARAAIILADPNHGQLADAQSTLMAVAIEKHNPQVHSIQELILSTNRDHLKAMNVDEVICLGEISEKLIAQSCVTPGVKNIFQNLLTSAKGTPQILLQRLDPGLNGMSFRTISRSCIKARAPFTIIGYIISPPEMLSGKEGRNMIKRIIMLNPKNKTKDLPLSENDKLIVIAYELPETISNYLKSAEEPSSS